MPPVARRKHHGRWLSREFMPLRKAEAPDQVGESRVRMKAVETGVNCQVDNLAIMLFISFIQAKESLVIFSEPGMDKSDVIERAATSLSSLLQLIQNQSRFFSFSRDGVSMPECR